MISRTRSTSAGALLLLLRSTTGLHIAASLSGAQHQVATRRRPGGLGPGPLAGPLGSEAAASARACTASPTANALTERVARCPWWRNQRFRNELASYRSARLEAPETVPSAVEDRVAFAFLPRRLLTFTR